MRIGGGRFARLRPVAVSQSFERGVKALQVIAASPGDPRRLHEESLGDAADHGKDDQEFDIGPTFRQRRRQFVAPKPKNQRDADPARPSYGAAQNAG